MMNKITNYVIAFLFLSVVTVYGFYLLSIDWSSILPAWSDEYFYYLNGLATYQFSSTKAAFTYNLQGADCLGADAHGFAYPILHSLFAYLIGWHNFNLVLLNQLILLCGLFIVFYQKGISITEKYWIALLYLAFPVTLQYAVIFMQESLQSFFGLCIGLMFYRLQQQKVVSKKNIILFLIVIFIAGLFRPLWFFWVILIFAFTKRKNIVLHSIVCIVYILFAFIYIKLFSEYVPNYFANLMNMLFAYQFEEFIYSFSVHFWANIKAYLKDSFSGYQFAYLGMKYLILLITGITLFKAIRAKHNQQTHWVVFALFTLNFFLLLGLYDAAWWREIRSLSILGYFYLPFLVKEKIPFLRYAITVAILVCFVLNLSHVEGNVQNTQNNQPDKLLKRQQSIDFTPVLNEEIPIIYIACGFIPSDNSHELLSLPLKTSKKQRIIYSIPYYKVALKRKPNYVLVRVDTPLTDYEKVFENSNFLLYRVGEGQEPAETINQLIYP